MTVFNQDIKVTNVSISSKEPKYSNRSWTGQQIIRSTGIQYYELSFSLAFNPIHRAEVMAFISTHSQGKPFTLSLGHLSQYEGQQAGLLLTTAVAVQGSSVITVPSVLEVGSLIQFINHKKLYRVIENTGNSITVFPPLRQQVQASEQVVYDNLIIEAVLDVDNDFNTPIQQIMQIEFKATEKL
ncbi:hypothetical protein [Cedecea lapagei]|uniref:hypothetical protein n=1 Tax=Cedecea lapagei TaxID=158823 RepID=UPI001BCADFF2|nr:hypothetical protein [Cedecea lapagei]